MEAFRYDSSAALASPERTPEGYLRCWATIARTGLQTYKRADGSVCVEYRPVDEVGNIDSLASFGGKAVTLEHPPELLTAENTAKYQKGFTDSEILFDGSYVKVRLTITDQDAIQSVERGDTLELSAGYQVDLDQTPGVLPNGQRFDAIQRNIRGNHVALTWKARAGSGVRVHLDSHDAVAIPEPHVQTAPSSMAKITLDGAEYEVDAGLASALTAHIQRHEQQVTSKLDSATADKASLETQVSELQSKLDSATGTEDELRSQIQTLQASLEEAKTEKADSAPDLDQLIAERIDLIEKAKPVLDSAFDFAGKSTREIHEAVVTTVHGDSVDLQGKSDDYVAARFDALVAYPFDSSAPLKTAVAASMRSDSSSKKNARHEYMKDQMEAYKPKSKSNC